MIATLVKEYEDEMEKKVTDRHKMDKLPMELAVSVPEEPSLMQIHEVLRRMLDKLSKATKFWLTSVSETGGVDLNDRLMYEIIQLSEEPEGSQTGMKVIGGIADRFFKANERRSHEHCANVFDRVSQQLRGLIKEAESNPSSTESLQDKMGHEIQWLQANYFEAAVGPAKEEVLISKLKDLKELGQRVAGFQTKFKEAINQRDIDAKKVQEGLKVTTTQ